MQQGGIAGVADLATQKNLVEAGAQDKIDPLRTGVVMAGGAATGAATSILHKGGTAKGESLGITPDGPPKQQSLTPEGKVDELAPVAPRPDVEGVAPEAGPGSSMPKSDKPVPSAPPSDAPAPSSVPVEKEPGPSGTSKQQAPTPEGAPKQEQPLGVRGEEPVSVMPGPEAQAPKEGLPTQSPPGENNAPKVSSEATEPRQIIDLTKHEDGGLHHPLSKHSGMSFEFLANRLKTEHHITGASTFHNHDEANMSVRLVLDKHADAIKAWFANSKLTKPKPFKLTPSDIGSDHGPIGLVLERGASELRPGTGIRIVLRKDATMPEGFRVITAYPTR